MTTDGLVLPGYRSLREVCAPLADEWSRCFSVVDLQSGPFDGLWATENEALVDRQMWNLPVFDNTSTCGLRPGTLPRLADHLILDEWSYYFAIDAPETEAYHKAISLDGHIGDFREHFLRGLDVSADLFMSHGDGWWEFFTGRADWHARLRQAWPECRTRPLREAGTAPG
jgi:hypothetical protein